MSQKDMFRVLKQKQIAADKWQAEGPGSHEYTVTDVSTSDLTGKSGVVHFTVAVDGKDKQELIGTVQPDGKESITRNGQDLPGADVDGDLAGHLEPIFAFPPKLKVRGNVIVKFRYSDDAEPDKIGQYRFEAPFGTISAAFPL